MWAFGMRLGHKSRVFTNEISALKKELAHLTPSAKWGHSKVTADYELGSGFSLDMETASWSWTSQPSELREINICWLSHPAYCALS